jgi:uncharacterized membrane protein
LKSTFDRIRQTISFEVIGLALVSPLGASTFGISMAGIVGIGRATIATIWNYLYNLRFDHVTQPMTGGTQKSVELRVVHAVRHRAVDRADCLVSGVNLLQAFLMNVSFALFYMV